MSKDKQTKFDFAKPKKDTGPVECLGQTFESDEARRKHYLALLAEKLKDPDFRKMPGFPKGTDEAILRMSDPPYYTACPNPFLEEFVRVHGRPYDPNEKYDCQPFSVDVSVGKTDSLYRAHMYHTKVPHLAIVPSILHYTKPGDLIFDGFCGSGMTGLAAQWCGNAPIQYKRKLEDAWALGGYAKPEWGKRNVVLNDLGPAATFIASGYNISFNVEEFASAAQEILDSVKQQLSWMYETIHSDKKTKCILNYTLWSESFLCEHCSSEVIFAKEALIQETKRVRKNLVCPKCGASSTKERMKLVFETVYDELEKRSYKRPKLVPTLINYSIGKERFEKIPDKQDLEILQKIERSLLPPGLTLQTLPDSQMMRVGRVKTTNIKAVHHFYIKRALLSVSKLWELASKKSDTRIRHALQYWIEQSLISMSKQNKYEPIQFGKANIKSSQVGRYMKGVFYVPSMTTECSPWYVLSGKLNRLVKAFSQSPPVSKECCITTEDCAAIPQIPGSYIDYIFTDPPFGENIYYADLNIIVESFHGVTTNPSTEAIVDRVRGKSTSDYQNLMRQCFKEYYRVLKPGRWMTVVFSNSKNHIWRAIQEAIGTAGFVVGDVRTLDKKQGSFKQVTSSAVKQDLIISAYKPTEALVEQFKLGSVGVDSVWTFISNHLRHVPVFVGKSGEADVISERTPQMLHDRMIAFFVQRGVGVPISGSDFLSGLIERYPERDGMYFLHGQVSEYDRKRTTVKELKQLFLFVSDETSATQWVRQQLHTKPQSFQDLQPQFMQQLQSWSKHEKTIELKEILELNFFCYDGTGPVPSQIKSYLSTNFKDMRNIEADNPSLQTKAKGRWYVPNPNKVGDLEKLRLRTLLKEFEEYRTSTSRKIKQFRTEAVRAGFKHCYDQSDYATIVAVAAKLPEKVIQEDEKLLMYYDVATMRIDD